MNWLTQTMLTLAVVILFAVDIFYSWLTARQRRLIMLQTHNLDLANKALLANATLMACASMNLSRARVELLHAGIEFELIEPPAWAVQDKETMT